MQEQLVVGYVAGRFDQKVIFPIASVVMAAMLVLAAVIWWTSVQHDRIAVRDEARLLETALAARLQSEADMLYDYAFWDEAYERVHVAPDRAWALENIVGWAHERLGVAINVILGPDGRAWLIARGGQPIDSVPEALLGERAWRHVAAVRETAPDRPRATFATVQGRLAVVTAAPVGTHTDAPVLTPGPPSVIVQVTFLDAAHLEELARTYLLTGLRLAGPTAPGGPQFPVQDAYGAAVATLTWQSLAPGQDMLARVLPVFAIVVIGLAAFTWVVLRHARDAAATLAVSEDRAVRDALTGLPNRRLLDERIAAAFTGLGKAGQTMALLYVDLDGFKPVNDALGHAAGDEVLVEVGRRLRAAARADDVVARIGGDEFVVLQGRGDQPAGATRLAETLLREVARPIVLDGAAIEVGASIGIALAPADAAAPRDLIRCADVALYRAKSGGRGTFRLFAEASLRTGPASASEREAADASASAA